MAAVERDGLAERVWTNAAQQTVNQFFCSKSGCGFALIHLVIFLFGMMFYSILLLAAASLLHSTAFSLSDAAFITLPHHSLLSLADDQSSLELSASALPRSSDESSMIKRFTKSRGSNAAFSKNMHIFFKINILHYSAFFFHCAMLISFLSNLLRGSSRLSATNDCPPLLSFFA